MSISNNTTKLQSLMDKINALPEAGSGSGGGVAIETCTVTVINGILVNGALETCVDVCLFEHIPTADEQWTFNYYAVNGVTEFEVPKNSLFCVRPYYELLNETVLAKTVEEGGIWYAGKTTPFFDKEQSYWEVFDTFFVYGDCTITGIVG